MLEVTVDENSEVLTDGKAVISVADSGKTPGRVIVVVRLRVAAVDDDTEELVWIAAENIIDIPLAKVLGLELSIPEVLVSAAGDSGLLLDKAPEVGDTTIGDRVKE